MIRYMILNLSQPQSIYFAAFLKTLAEGVILASSAAFFLPETLQSGQGIPLLRYLFLLITGLYFLFVGAIFVKKGGWTS